MKQFIVISAFLIVIVGCKKYSEDPFISLRKPKHRLLSGHSESGEKSTKWKLSSYKINGEENIDLFKLGPQFNTENYPPVIQFIIDGGRAEYNGNLYGSGIWYINKSEHYDYLHIYMDGGGPPSGQTWPFIFYHDSNWSNFNMHSVWLIKRLYGKKMHLIQYTNNNTYELFFEKQ